jgi:pheromone shutdown-related protein TraB
MGMQNLETQLKNPLDTLVESENAPLVNDIIRLQIGDKQVILVGTAHISQHSTELVQKTIQEEQPDCVCVELDARRAESLRNPNRWDSLNLKEIIRKQQLSSLIANLMLSSYQKRLGMQTGVKPGAELQEAVLCAEQNNIPVELIDRDIQITLKRAWRKTSFWKKSVLISSLFASLFDKTEINEEELARIRQQDVLSEMLKEMAKELPVIKEVLIDERDAYLAQKIRTAPGSKIVAVIGKGHQAGIVDILTNDEPVDLAPITAIPPAAPWGKMIGWGIPSLIVGMILYIGFTKGVAIMGDNALYWILANGIPSGIGAALALAHPLTILAAFLSAPFTSLTPVIGAGYVTAFVQAWVMPPRVNELQSVAEDISHIKKWWSNRLLRIFLAFIGPGLGSFLGTWLGGIRLFQNL